MPSSDSSKPDKVLKSECKSAMYSSGSICLLQHPTTEFRKGRVAPANFYQKILSPNRPDRAEIFLRFGLLHAGESLNFY